MDHVVDFIQTFTKFILICLVIPFTFFVIFTLGVYSITSW